MESYDFLLAIAIILLTTKVFGILSQKVNMPQVVGALLAGIILGPSCLNMIYESDFIIKTSEIGVIMLMFLAGLDTDIEELKKTGVTSLVIAAIGVIVPLIGGYITYDMFFPSQAGMAFYKKIFMGVILTATSVSISVETLREMGKLKGRMGTAILGAAIIDDILGIIILTITTSFTDASVNPINVFGKIGLFFIFICIVGFIINFIFKKMEDVYGSRRRTTIYSFAFCLLMAYASEKLFGVADITGAYFAGLILCNITKTKQHIARKVNIASYMIFSPVFFASIGLKTSINGLTGSILGFSAVLVIMAILTKMIGCGLGAKICGFSGKESLGVGIGMISRCEVALIVAQKGAQAGLLNDSLFPAVVLMVIVTTLITPTLLTAIIGINKDEAVNTSIDKDFILNQKSKMA